MVTEVEGAVQTGVREFTCTRCEQEFPAGAWTGCLGNFALGHIVESKTYYHKTSDGFNVIVRPDQTIVNQTTGQAVTTGVKRAQFGAGRFSTTDPETQARLDAHEDLCSHDEFMDYRTPDSVRTQRLKTTVVEQQKLIEQLKAQNAALANPTPETGKGEGPAEPGEHDDGYSEQPTAKAGKAGAKGKGK